MKKPVLENKKIKRYKTPDSSKQTVFEDENLINNVELKNLHRQIHQIQLQKLEELYKPYKKWR